MVRAMRIALRSRLSPIWGQKQFVRFWLGESISMIGSGVSTFAVPLVAVITLRASPSQMGVLSAVGAAPGILLGLFAGVWVDRVSRQRLLIATELIAAALVASVPVSYALGSLSFAQLFGVALGFARRVIRSLTGLEPAAPISGQRALRPEVARAVLPFARGFGMEIGMTVDAHRAGYRLVEVELDLEHRATGRTAGGFVHRARQLLAFARVYASRR